LENLEAMIYHVKDLSSYAGFAEKSSLCELVCTAGLSTKDET